MNIVSEAAEQFIENAEPLEAWSLDSIEALRAEEHQEAALTNEPIIGAYVAEITKTEVGGVSALTVTPRRYDPRNDNCRILYFFGGAFVVGSPEVDLPIIARLAVRLGMKVVAPYYRRAPEHPYPAAVDDGFHVYRVMLESVGADGLAVVGESAGGNLSLAVTIRAAERGIDVPAALVLMSPWCDLTQTGETQRRPAGFDPTLDYEMHLREPAAAYAGSYDQKDPRISPVYAGYPAGFPPTLITTGTRELFLSDCERLAAKMQQAEIDVRLRVWEGMWHVFEWYVDIPEADQSLDEIADFLKEQVTGTAA